MFLGFIIIIIIIIITILLIIIVIYFLNIFQTSSCALAYSRYPRSWQLIVIENPGAPSDHFFLNTMKTLFKPSRVVLDL